MVARGDRAILGGDREVLGGDRKVLGGVGELRNVGGGSVLTGGRIVAHRK